MAPVSLARWTILGQCEAHVCPVIMHGGHGPGETDPVDGRANRWPYSQITTNLRLTLSLSGMHWAKVKCTCRVEPGGQAGTWMSFPLSSSSSPGEREC